MNCLSCLYDTVWCLSFLPFTSYYGTGWPEAIGAPQVTQGPGSLRWLWVQGPQVTLYLGPPRWRRVCGLPVDSRSRSPQMTQGLGCPSWLRVGVPQVTQVPGPPQVTEGLSSPQVTRGVGPSRWLGCQVPCVARRPSVQDWGRHLPVMTRSGWVPADRPNGHPRAPRNARHDFPKLWWGRWRSSRWQPWRKSGLAHACHSSFGPRPSHSPTHRPVSPRGRPRPRKAHLFRPPAPLRPGSSGDRTLLAVDWLSISQ